jgi:RsiW-degrading membrane proteinase PrsW (M82 family)
MMLALLPLAVFTLSGPDDTPERYERAMDDHPELTVRLMKGQLTEEEFIRALPGQRIEGAFLSHSTWGHWGMAALAAGLFWGFIIAAFPLGRSTSQELWSVALFTGTIGILLLFGIQWVASLARGVTVFPGGLAGLLFLLARLIGDSYGAALDSGRGFIPSLLGFTIGVGLCEELAKAIPLLWRLRKPEAWDLPGCVAWGLAVGVGFGVSEGITYASGHYNGYSGPGIYVVRFVSCVALHSVWSGISALLIWKARSELRSIARWHDAIFPILKVLGISMALHGLYDTCLKKGFNVAALGVGVASFVVFLRLYEKSRSPERLAALRFP